MLSTEDISCHPYQKRSYRYWSHLATFFGPGLGSCPGLAAGRDARARGSHRHHRFVGDGPIGGSIPLEPNGARVRRWFQEKKAGWYAVLADPQMPVTSTLFDQAHHAIERKFFAMKGFHHPRGKQQACLTGLAHVSNLMPYQRRAQHAGHCGVEVEGGRVPR
jgi:hypothetical protein